MAHRDDLLERVRTDREGLERVVTALRDRLDEPIGDGWRVRDVVAHIALWERVAARKIAGRPLIDPADPLAQQPWNLNTYNEEMRRRWWDRPVAEVLAEFESAHRDLVAAVRGADESRCAPGGDVAKALDDDGPGHYGAHLPELRALAGDERP